MKWFLLFLLALNAALLAWGLQKEPQEESSVQQVAGAGMGNLRLLSEVKPLEKAPEEDVTVDVVQSEESMRQEGMAAEVVDSAEILQQEALAVDQGKGSSPAELDENSVGDALQLPMPGLSRDEVDEATDSRSSAVTEAVKQTVDAPDEEAATDTDGRDTDESSKSPDQSIALMEESESAAPEVIPVTSQPSAEIRDALVEKTVEQQCVTAGPIKSGIAARDLSEKVEAQGMQASLRQETFRQVVRFWVLIPARENQEAAIAMVEKLQQAGVEDMRRFVRGKRKNAISLGAFSRRENAQVRQRELAAKGFRTDIQSDEEESSVYWVDISGELELGQQLSRVIGQIDKDVLTRKQECIRVVTR